MLGLQALAALAASILFISGVSALPKGHTHHQRQEAQGYEDAYNIFPDNTRTMPFRETVTVLQTVIVSPHPFAQPTQDTFASFTVEPSHSSIRYSVPSGFAASGFGPAVATSQVGQRAFAAIGSGSNSEAVWRAPSGFRPPFSGSSSNGTWPPARHGHIPTSAWPSAHGPYPTGAWPTAHAPAPTGSAAWPHPSPNATLIATPASSSTLTTSSTVPSARSQPSVFRGVNLGGWLILEQWMTPSLFDGTGAIDQWTFDSTDGAKAKLQQHWSTWYTEADIAKVASWGLNALRIPIGYWAFASFNQGTPYIQGAQGYLDKAIEWARKYDMWVMVDCHGSPGSQNGKQHSGHNGSVSWQDGRNLQLSIRVLETIAEKYGSLEFADVVYGIEFVNEPDTSDGNRLSTTQSWACAAYDAVKRKATNPNLYGIMHDAWVGAENWMSVAESCNAASSPNASINTLNGTTASSDAHFALDLHLYQNQSPDDSTLDLAGHISKTCGYSTTQFLPSATASQLPLFIGEFSAQLNLCANPDGSTLGGGTCTQSDCQCNTQPLNANATDNGHVALRNALRMFVEAQIQTFESAGARGWDLWSLKSGEQWWTDNWSLYGVMNGLYGEGEGLMEFKYPGVCGQVDDLPSLLSS